MQHGLILFAHGARDPRWAAPFEAVAAQVRLVKPEVVVQLAFLEFMSPTLPEAVRTLVDEHCQRIQVLPMFLGAGGHVRKDLPVLLDAARAAHPGLVLSLGPAIGEIESVTQAMAQAALHQLAEAP